MYLGISNKVDMVSRGLKPCFMQTDTKLVVARHSVEEEIMNISIIKEFSTLLQKSSEL